MRRHRWSAFVAVVVILAACTAGTPTSPPSAGGSASPGASAAAKGSAVIGTPTLSVGVVPLVMAVEKMNELGYDVRILTFGTLGTLIQAGVSENVDVIVGSAPAQIIAMDGGYPFRLLMNVIHGEFTLVGKAGLTDCDSLNGLRVGYHSQVSSDGLMVQQWVKEKCTTGVPNQMIVNGSENRLIGLLENQLDAATLGIDGLVEIQKERPGDFTIIEPFWKDPAKRIYITSYAAAPAWVNENREMVKDMIRSQLEAYAEIYADPNVLINKSKEILPELEPEIVELQARAYLDAGHWPENGGMDREVMERTLQLARDGTEGGFTTVKTFDDVADRTLLDEVLAESR